MRTELHEKLGELFSDKMGGLEATNDIDRDIYLVSMDIEADVILISC
jgi:hypothetical protein